MDHQEQHRQEEQGLGKALREGQRRALTSTLRHLENAVLQLPLHGAPSAPAMSRLTAHCGWPTPDQQREWQRISQEMLKEIHLLAQVYRLEPQQEHHLRSIAATVTLAWCDLQDVHPQKLKDYGEVSPLVVEDLAPRVQHVSELVLAIAQRTEKA